jgi:hypothetical protein
MEQIVIAYKKIREAARLLAAANEWATEVTKIDPASGGTPPAH